MSNKPFLNLLTHQPRVQQDGVIVYNTGFDPNKMFQEYGHHMREWRDRDPKTKDLIGTPRLVTVLGTESGKAIAKGFEAIEMNDDDGELLIETGTDKSRYATYGRTRLIRRASPCWCRWRRMSTSST